MGMRASGEKEIQGYYHSSMALPRRVALLALGLLLAAGVASAADPPVPRWIYPRAFVHYVDWYSKCPNDPACGGWNQVTTIPWLADSLPGIGYASDDPAVIHQHNHELWDHDLVPLISWWGPDTPLGGDRFLDLYLSLWDEEAPVRIGLLYEVTGRLKLVNDIVDFNDPENADRFVADIRHLQEKYWSRYPDRFYWADNRPVLFIWLTHTFRGPFDVVAARARQEAPVYLIGSDYNTYGYFRPGLEQVARALDAESSYSIYSPLYVERNGAEVGLAHATAYQESVGLWSDWLAQNAPGVKLLLPLSFAFDDTRVFPPREHPPLRCTDAGAELLATTARRLIEISQLECGNISHHLLFVSYNEHYEGTALEPNNVHGNDFLAILTRTLATPVERSADCLR